MLKQNIADSMKKLIIAEGREEELFPLLQRFERAAWHELVFSDVYKVHAVEIQALTSSGKWVGGLILFNANAVKAVLVNYLEEMEGYGG